MGLLHAHSQRLGDLLHKRIGPEVRGVYEHWDHLRHLTPPQGLTVEQWWLGIKLARSAAARDWTRSRTSVPGRSSCCARRSKKP